MKNYADINKKQVVDDRLLPSENFGEWESNAVFRILLSNNEVLWKLFSHRQQKMNKYILL